MNPVKYFDTHCHLKIMADKDPQSIQRLHEDLAQGRIARVIDIGTDISDLPARLELMRQCGVDWYSVGLYPSHAASPELPNMLKVLAETIRLQTVHKSGSPRLVAIGEIGIDCHWNYAPVNNQAVLFQCQVELANSFGLPILVHNREADGHLLEALRSSRPQYGGIMHCFSSDYDFARRMIDLGFLISFAGNLTYKSAQNIQEAARRLPLEQIVLETDAPYLSPEPCRGKPNHPGHITHTYAFLANLRGISLEALGRQVESNVCRLFGQ